MAGAAGAGGWMLLNQEENPIETEAANKSTPENHNEGSNQQDTVDQEENQGEQENQESDENHENEGNQESDENQENQENEGEQESEGGERGGGLTLVEGAGSDNEVRLVVENNSEHRLLGASITPEGATVAVLFYNLPAGNRRILEYNHSSMTSTEEFQGLAGEDHVYSLRIFEDGNIANNFERRYQITQLETGYSDRAYHDAFGQFPLPDDVNKDDITGREIDTIGNAEINRIEDGTVHFTVDSLWFSALYGGSPLKFTYTTALEENTVIYGSPERESVFSSKPKIEEIIVDEDNAILNSVIVDIPSPNRNLVEPTITVHALPQGREQIREFLDDNYNIGQKMEVRNQATNGMIAAQPLNNENQIQINVDWNIPTPVPEDLFISVMINEAKLPLTYVDDSTPLRSYFE